jgi:DNA-binding Lrp family transcriptional regulator
LSNVSCSISTSSIVIIATLRSDGRAVMMIEVAGRSASAIIRQLRSFPQLRALHTTNGAWDLIAEISAEDLQSFDRILREIRSIDGILNSETSLLLSTA